MGRDLASLAATMPEFRVGYLGRGSVGNAKFPWTQYAYPDSAGWGQEFLPGVARDFFGGDHGIVFSNWDVSRLTWMPKPHERDWDLWLYTPVDSTGPDGSRFTYECRDALNSFNRVMAASEFGMNVLKNSGRLDADFLPHGIFTDVFFPQKNPRKLLNWDEHDIWVGFVAANQPRKDYPVAFETAALLRKTFGARFRFWCHTDKMIHAWNIYALAADYGISDCLRVTTHATDEQMALYYSACDCTILPSASEGFGLPIAESLACGTPCIVTDYAAGPELVSEDCRVKPVAFRIETTYNVQRAVLSGYGFARLAEEQIERKRVDPQHRGEELRESVAHLDWQKLKYPWMRWLKDGLR